MKIPAWIEIVSVVGVITSLGLLTWELNQANSIARFEAKAAIRQGYNVLNLEMATDQEFAKLWSLLSDVDPKLSDEQVQNAIGLAYLNMTLWSTVEAAYGEGLVPKTELDRAVNDIRTATSVWPGLNPYLRMAISQTREGQDLGEVGELIFQLTESR